MVAILTGFFCIRFKLLTPAEGHLKGLGFFIGSMVFPLLIFNTVATAELHSVNYGVIAACSLGKVAVMILTWLLAYLMYQRKRSRGQRILTASVFAFFSVASNDFAIGFPVIDALYEKDMSIYITGNALVGSFVFIPLTMVAFAIGGAIRTGEGQSTWKIFKDILYDLSTNPVIFMTCSGLLYKIILGSSIVEENGKLQLPHPLSDFVTLFTSPFAMSALFLTGTALRSPRISAWAIGMVLMKVVVCAYLSYFFGTLFLRGEHNKPLRDFTFFYGAIPTSSAPIVFANQFDPDAAELVATAVLFGLVLAGPIMFITAYSLNQEDESTSMVILREAQLSADAASILAGLGFCVCLGVLRQYWCFTCPAKQLLAVYGIVLTAYAAVSFYINPSTFIPSTTCEDFKEMDLRTPSVVVFSWLQNSASCLLLVLQFFYVCGPKVSSNAPLKGLAFVSGCLLFALMPAFLATPNTINEICGHEEFNSLQLCLNVIWSCTKLAVALSLALYAICKKGPPRDGGSESTESESETDSEDLPARTNSDLEKNSREWEILVPRVFLIHRDFASKDRWPQIAKKGPDGAKEILEDRTITSVSSRKLGWAVGDTIQEINGEEAKARRQSYRGSTLM
eukprot:Skav214505  [mRNA]  locus=scaffold1011:376340:385615:- [translate_table: standard]